MALRCLALAFIDPLLHELLLFSKRNMNRECVFCERIICYVVLIVNGWPENSHNLLVFFQSFLQNTKKKKTTTLKGLCSQVILGGGSVGKMLCRIFQSPSFIEATCLCGMSLEIGYQGLLSHCNLPFTEWVRKRQEWNMVIKQQWSRGSINRTKQKPSCPVFQTMMMVSSVLK